MADRKFPTGRAGNYAAPIDTSGMDPQMKDTLTGKQSEPPFITMLKRMFHGAPKVAKTAADKSGSVLRTSDVPQGGNQ